MDKVEKAQRGYHSALPDRWKRLTQEQWGKNPCGAHVAREFEFGTREYFDSIEEYRYREYAPWMKEALAFDRYAGKRVLEIGCGTGTDLLQFERGGAHVTGIDLTPRSIEISRQRFEVYGLKGGFAIGDAESLAFPDESFDVVYSFGVLHHTPDTERAISEAHRDLGGGRPIVMISRRASFYYWGGLMLKRGVFKGELARRTPAEIMRRYVEYTETGGRPLVKAYTRREACHLFRNFSDCQIRVNQLTRKELGLAGRMLPENAFQWLAHK